MSAASVGYGKLVTVDTNFARTVARVRAELLAEGFAVLTEIDVTATMRAKLGEEIEDYVILGACNAPMAFQALQADRSFGLLLPCNVVVRSGAAGTIVEVLDFQFMVAMANAPMLEQMACDASARLDRVLNRIRTT